MEIPKFIRERYEVVIASDVVRDGMAMELWDVPTGELLIEVFYSDEKGTMTAKQFRNIVPAEVSEWLLEEAQRQLPPQAV